jgi:hypothetical protein
VSAVPRRISHRPFRPLSGPLLAGALQAGALLASALLAGACSEEQEAMIVTVEVRPSVIGAEKLAVQLRNGAGIAGDSFELDGQSFPLTFSVSSPGRTGDLQIEVSATNEAGYLVGRGEAIVPITAETGKVLVDSADFVVNSIVMDDQYLTDDSESAGTQLSANSSGTWVASYRQRCTPAACNLYARRFGRDGQAILSGEANADGFPINSALKVGSFFTSPTVTAGEDKTLLLWDTTATTTADGVACRSIDKNGALAAESRLATDTSTDVVVATALPNGTFAIGWSSRVGAETNSNVRTLVVDGNCAPLPLATIQAVGTLIEAPIRRSTIAASGANSYLMAWQTNNTIRARTIGLDGTPSSSDTLLLAPGAVGESYDMARLAANNNGYVMAVSHRVTNTTKNLELYRLTATAGSAPAITGSATVVTDKLDLSSEGFSIASHPIGPILVTWHGCEERGDGENCGVFGRLFATNGSPLGEAFIIPTTTALNQKFPSVTPLVGEDGQAMFVVAWNDESTSPPDMGGQAVRARIIYPPPQ